MFKNISNFPRNVRQTPMTMHGKLNTVACCIAYIEALSIIDNTNVLWYIYISQTNSTSEEYKSYRKMMKCRHCGTLSTRRKYQKGTSFAFIIQQVTESQSGRKIRKQ